MTQRITPLSCQKIERKLLRLGFKFTYSNGAVRFYEREKDGTISIVSIHWHHGDKSADIVRDEIFKNGNISRKEWLSV